MSYMWWTLSPDRKKLYVTNVGMFEYRLIPGADPAQPRATGLPFPAFGFPSSDAVSGAERRTEKGLVQVPGLGDPNVRESNSLCVVDVSNPAAAKVEAFIRTGVPFGQSSDGGSGPTADRGVRPVERWRQQSLRRGGHCRPRICFQFRQRQHYRDRPPEQPRDGGNPHPHSGARNAAGRAAHRHGVPRKDGLAAGSGSGHQRHRGD